MHLLSLLKYVCKFTFLFCLTLTKYAIENGRILVLRSENLIEAQSCIFPLYMKFSLQPSFKKKTFMYKPLSK